MGSGQSAMNISHRCLRPILVGGRAKRVAHLGPTQERPRSIPCSLTNCSQRLLSHLDLCFSLPEEASSEIDFFVMCDMKPTIEKITNPANMLVVEFIQQTMMESLEERKKEKKPPAGPYQEARSKRWGEQKSKPCKSSSCAMER